MYIKNVRKRNGRIVTFNKDKIINVVTKAFAAIGEEPNGKPEEVTDKIVKTLGKKFIDEIPTVEDIQDAVEFELMDDYKNVAKAYILYRQKKREDRLQKQLIGVSDDLKLSVNAVKILEERYLIKDENGNVVETPTQMFRRVANNIAQAEKLYDGKEDDVRHWSNKFYKMMINLDFMPNSPCLANAGRPLQMLSACLSKDTELLTKNGWCNHEQYFDEEVLTYDMENDTLEFQKPIAKIEHVSESMVWFKNRTLDILVTPEHDIVYTHGLVRNKIKAKAKYFVGKRGPTIAIPLCGKYIFPEIEKVNLTQSECELLGWIFTDGYLCKNHGNHKDVGIIVTQTLYCRELESCLNACGIIWTKYVDRYRIHSKSARKYRNYFDSNKTFDWQFLFSLSYQQVLALWKGIYYGDAQKRNGSYAITQENTTRRNQIQVLAILLGKSVHYTVNSRKKHVINVADRTRLGWFIPRLHVSMVHYNDIAWCVQVPNGNILIRKNGKIAIVGNCFVIPVEDSIDGIFDAIKSASVIHKAGGGTGFSFSRLRPFGDFVKTTTGIASGPVGDGKDDGFIHIFDKATDVIKQGSYRRGANMGILHVSHPDIFTFISSKLQPGKLENFNISVALSDDFMNTLYSDSDFTLIHPRTKEEVRKVKASSIWNSIIHYAWQTGDPGAFFIDRYNNSPANPCPKLMQIEATNPCAEQGLYPYDSCNLGSVVLSNFVKDGKVDYDRLKTVVHSAVRFLDNVIDMNRYPLKEIDETTKKFRRIGLGVMGWADMLIELGIAYNSEKALTLADEVMSFIDAQAKEVSSKLAEERGTFKAWKQSIYYPHTKLRNGTVTTIAPTGTISIIANCSGGIEPIFAVAYNRTTSEGIVLPYLDERFERIAKQKGFWSEELKIKVIEKGSVQRLDEVPENVKSLFLTANEIPIEQHVKMQATFQKHVDNAISKTLNLPNSATVQDVDKTYRLAWELGCKSVTVFRDGCRQSQVLRCGLDGCNV